MRAKRGVLVGLMHELGVSCGVLASKVGCSPATVAAVRAGRVVRRTTAVAIAAQLGKDVEALFDAAPAATKAA